LTSCGFRNFEQVKSFCCPSKDDLNDGTSMVRGATFLQNAEIVPYEFLIELCGNENGFSYGAPHSSSGKWNAINRGACFTESIPR